MRTLFTTLLLLGFATPALAACDREVPVDELYDAMELANMSFSSGDNDSTLGAIMYAEAVFPCVVAPIQRPSVAQYHRLVGLKSSLMGEADKAKQAWGAARGIEPFYEWPAEVNAATNEVLTGYGALDPATLASDNHPPAASGYLMFDGRPGQERPNNFPTVVQRVDDAGKVTDTVYLWPGDEMLAYEAFRAPTGPAVATGDIAELPPAKGPPQPSKPLLASAGGAAVVGAALWGVAALQHKQWADPATPYEDLAALEKRTNGLMVGATVAGVAAAGLGVTVVATW